MPTLAQMKKIEERLLLLSQVHFLLAEERNYKKGLKRVGLRVVNGVADGCVFIVREDMDKQRVITAGGVKMGPKKFLEDKAMYPVLQKVMREGKVKMARIVDFGSVVVVPLRAREKVMGVMGMVCFEEGGFRKEDMVYFQELANRIAILVDNIVLFQKSEQENRWRRDYQRILEESERRFRSVFDKAIEAMVIMDEERLVVDANQSALNMLDKQAKRIFGKVMPGMEGRGGAKLWSKMHKKGELQGELEMVTPKDKIKTLEYSMSADFIPGRHLVVMRDVTEKKQTEKRKEDFLGVASHEMKTPLAIIKAYAQLLQKNVNKWEREKLVQYLAKIESNADRLAKIVYDILDVTRIKEGRLDFFDEEIEVEGWIENVVGDMKQIAPDREIELTGGAKVKIFADKTRMRQVLTNLIKNAIDYSATGKKVTVKTRVDERGLVVGVRDRGVGVDENQKSKLFDLYHRGQENNNRGRKGMGVGLYIANQIVKHYEGKIWVEGKQGKGSTFYFSIPAKRFINL